MRKRLYPLRVRGEYFRLNTKWRIFHGRLTTIYHAKAESARHLLTKSITTSHNCSMYTDQRVVSTSAVVLYHLMYIPINKSNQVRVTEKLFVL